MELRLCAAPGCLNEARRRYCSDGCASRSRQRRCRVRRVDVVVVVEFGPRWLRGIEAPLEILEVFADDAERYARMGICAKRDIGLV
jgi:hypothetical protein